MATTRLIQSRRSHIGFLFIILLLLFSIFTPFIAEEDRAFMNGSSKWVKNFSDHQLTGAARHITALKHLRIHKMALIFVIFSMFIIKKVSFPILHFHTRFSVIMKRLFLMPIKFTSTYVAYSR
ncbi:hypothetical protein [Paenibacillus apiarius]|uniref:hypothetical protein n=1 Tax=Paenibacillus apiarius TaxID=46240 RepID=UPI00197DC9BC|nr:hypothetical protein [Paenibacillus apiarius]MBN3526122.1 hypothetical protein [Paenibacillus apiarius]